MVNDGDVDVVRPEDLKDVAAGMESADPWGDIEERHDGAGALEGENDLLRLGPVDRDGGPAGAAGERKRAVSEPGGRLGEREERDRVGERGRGKRGGWGEHVHADFLQGVKETVWFLQCDLREWQLMGELLGLKKSWWIKILETL